MRGAVARARELLAEIPGSVMPQQFENPANPLVHRVSTAEEIWNDTGGEVDAVVSGVGTAGTITGVGQVLKASKPSVRMIARRARRLGGAVRRPARAAQDPGHRRAASCPAILDRGVIDEIMPVSNERRFEMARKARADRGRAGGHLLRRGAVGRLRLAVATDDGPAS